MSSSHVVAFSIAVVLATSGAVASAGTYRREELVVGEVPREFFVYTPDGLPPGPTPVVLAFHGYLSDASGMRWITKMDKFADAAGFLVIYPNAVDKSWNAGRGSGSKNRTTDDLSFARALLANLEARPEVDRNRMYALGFSNGAQMVATIVCKLENRLAAAAMVAHSLNIPDCQPVSRVPMLLIQGRKDPFVPFDGGGSSQLASHAFTVDFFRELDGAEAPPRVVVELPSVTCTESVDRAGREQVLECTGQEDGHTWPGGVAFQPEVFGKTNGDLLAGEVMFEFFARHAEPAPRRELARAPPARPAPAPRPSAPPSVPPPSCAAVVPVAPARRAVVGRAASGARPPARSSSTGRAVAPAVRPSPRGRLAPAAPAAGSVRTAAPAAGSVRTAAPAAGSVRTAAPAASSVRTAAPAASSVRTAAPAAGRSGSVSTGAPVGHRAAPPRPLANGTAAPRGTGTAGTAPRAAVVTTAPRPSVATAAPARPRAATPGAPPAPPPARLTAPPPLAPPASPPDPPAESRWQEASLTLPGGARRRYFAPLDFAGARMLVLVFPDGAFRPDAVEAALGIRRAPATLRYVLLDPELYDGINAIVDQATERAGGPLTVAAIGIGAGGAAAQRLFCERSDLLSSVVLIGSSFKGPPCMPTPVPALLALQTTGDGRAPPDGDAKQGLLSQAELRNAYRFYVGQMPDPAVKTGPGYVCTGGRPPKGSPEVRTCRVDSKERGVPSGSPPGSFDAPAVIFEFLGRHLDGPEAFTIVHAR